MRRKVGDVKAKQAWKRAREIVREAEEGRDFEKFAGDESRFLKELLQALRDAPEGCVDAEARATARAGLFVLEAKLPRWG